jgi:hypothetical protein
VGLNRSSCCDLDVNWGTKASPIPDMNFRRGLRKRWMGGSIPKNAPGSTNV